MDLEGISKKLLSGMDARNITSLVISLITQFGREGKRMRPITITPTAVMGTNLQLPAINGNNQQVEGDDTDALAYNLSNLLLANYENDTDLLDTIMSNLQNEGIRNWKERGNLRLSYATFIIIITIYTLMIAVGSFGNFLVVSSAVRQPKLRTPRNAFILNLAVSDLLLCLVTMPLTLVEIVNNHWPLGDSAVSCKVAGGLQAVSVFVSTISITVIALDRYQLIVYPTKDLLKRIGAAAALFFIWLLGFLLALPIFMVRTLEHHDIYSPKWADAITHPESPGSVRSVDYCYENWPFNHGRAIYSALTLVIQYILPILIISVLHTRICHRLRTRHTALKAMTVTKDSRKRINEAKRLRRRRHLLLAIALFFSIAWLPLNVLNLVLDIYNPFSFPGDEEKMLIIYAVCHLFGMSSACANPFLYGWFNGNFRSEFVKILGAPLKFCFPSDIDRVGGSFSSVANRSSTASPDIAMNTVRVVERHKQSTTIDRTDEGNVNAAADAMLDYQQPSVLMSTKYAIEQKGHDDLVDGVVVEQKVVHVEMVIDVHISPINNAALTANSILVKKQKVMETHL